jgi:hypothetical protein
MMVTAAAAEKHYAPEAACRFLHDKFGIKRTEGTFAKARSVGGDAPCFRRVGRNIYYAERDLRAWAEGRLGTAYRSTSDPGRLARLLGELADQDRVHGESHQRDKAGLGQDVAVEAAGIDASPDGPLAA